MLGHAPGWGFWDRGTIGTELALSQVKIKGRKKKEKKKEEGRGRKRRGGRSKKRRKACEYRGFQGTSRQVK